MGAWEEIVDYTVPSNTTSVTLNNFGTITKDDFIKIHFTNINNASVTNPIRLFANDKTNPNDYHTQQLRANGSSVSAARFNSESPRVNVANGSQTSNSFTLLKLSENNVYNLFSNYTRENNTSVHIEFEYSTSSNATFPNGINTLTFSGVQTNGIGTNSRIQIYKLTAEKVADINVTSNTTQVDITGLDIKKGDEYLLVGDVENNDNAIRNFNLYPNDLTTSSNYYSQVIGAEGNSAPTSRLNASYLEFIREFGKTIFYTHIKLSNIGSFNFQNYALREYGTSAPEIRNFFTSSTSENITSISKLNIVASSSNVIKSGTRFQLYKLYEGGN